MDIDITHVSHRFEHNFILHLVRDEPHSLSISESRFQRREKTFFFLQVKKVNCLVNGTGAMMRDHYSLKRYSYYYILRLYNILNDIVDKVFSHLRKQLLKNNQGDQPMRFVLYSNNTGLPTILKRSLSTNNCISQDVPVIKIVRKIF